MSVIGSNILAGASGQGGAYNLERSLRFRSSASAYLNRTPASAGNLRTWTWSAWVKRGELGNKNLFACTSTQHYIGFNGGNGFNFQYDAGGVNDYKIFTNQVFRDPSAWYHIVAVWDTTNATSASRMRLYVNGEQITSLSASNYPPQNYDGSINSTNAHTLGSYGTASYFDGYLTEVNFIDGQALTPSSFGETSSTTGVWQPKRYSGSYGTNGFYLPFTDNSALTTSSNVGLGKDFSGNGNYWTTNNISITSGSTYDSMTDVPTLTSETASNFAVLNAVNQASNTITDGNLQTSFSYHGGNRSTIGMSSGKWYFEVSPTTCPNFTVIGIVSASVAITADLSSTNAITYLSQTGYWWRNNTGTAYGASYTSSDTIGVAVDVDNNSITFYKNGVSQGAITSVTLTGDTWFACIGNAASSATVGVFNFGQRPFAYTPPANYVALNTYNLPTPTIGATASSQANKYFDAITWTGTGTTSNRTITGLNFQPDFVWAKSRSAAYDHCLYDAVRGAGANKELISNNANAEGGGNQDQYGYLSSFNSDGFSSTVGSLGQNLYFNDTAYPAYVAWNWKANGSGSTNTAGSITSTVSANTTSGFSIVTWTGSGSSPVTIGHGLGVAPKMFVIKRRNNTGDDWSVYHASVGDSARLKLNTTAASQTNILFWNNTSPTSTVFTLGGDFADTNTYVAYCFSAVAGYSAFGSFTGNGSTNGPFVHLGFKPRYVLFKNSSTSVDWKIFDSARNTYNAVTQVLYPNLSNAEDANTGLDFTSNGFKVRDDGTAFNGNGNTIIYAAFAEHPFKYSLGR